MSDAANGAFRDANHRWPSFGMREDREISTELMRAPPDLEPQWRALEAQAEGSFFTTWAWVGCWLQSLARSVEPWLLRAIRNGAVVGLALLVERPGRRLGIVPQRCLFLHATGDSRQDAVAVEHNGFLVHHGDAEAISAAMFARLLTALQRWDQVALPGLRSHPRLDRSLLVNHALRSTVRKSYVVDLGAVRDHADGYLGVLGASARSQLRRSIKVCERLGPLSVIEARSLDTASTHLEALMALHEKRWAARGQAGAFANPAFSAFHRRLVEQTFATGSVQLLRIQAGSHDIGYLYNLVCRKRVLFYQSGFDYDRNPRNERPGLVAHAMSVLHNAQLGNDVYDFLAGESQYKRSLSTSEETMTWSILHRRSVVFRVEDVLRRVKRRMFEGKQGGRSPVEPVNASGGTESPCLSRPELRVGNVRPSVGPAMFVRGWPPMGRD